MWVYGHGCEGRIRRIQKSEGPNSELRTPNPELRTPNSEPRTANGDFEDEHDDEHEHDLLRLVLLRTPNSEPRTPNPELRTPNPER